MTVQTINASAHSLPMIADESVHAVITSPAYWGLRAYAGEQDVEWPTVAYSPIAGMPEITISGCDPDCRHEWVEAGQKRSGGGEREYGSYDNGTGRGPAFVHPGHAYCLHCGGWRGGLGMEPTIEAYIGHLVLCAREWWRVLRDDGTLWLNLGDSYAGSWGNYGARNGNQRSRVAERWHRPAYDDEQNGWDGLPSTANVPGLKAKNLCMIPARVALALQADGWILRHAVPWVKRNALPGSQKDRPTTAHEYVYLFAKSERYYYDQHAVKLPYAPGSLERELRGVGDGHKNVEGAPGQTPHSLAQPRPNKSATFAKRGGSKEAEVVPGQAYAEHRDGRENESVYENGGRYRRDSDWFFDSLRFILDTAFVEDGGQGLLRNEAGDPLALVVNTKGFSGAHFAVWPPTLVEPMILASTSERGVCPACGAPWERVVEKEGQQEGRERNRGGREDGFALPAQWENGQNPTTTITTGWRPTCGCEAIPHEWDRSFLPEGVFGGTRGAFLPCKHCESRWYFSDEEWEDEPSEPCPGHLLPATVLDPFHGSGTTGAVAVANRRGYIGVDISAYYLAEHDRISGVQIKLI